MDIRAKDYLVVDDKLYLAVVSDNIEAGRALSWLRYIKDNDGMHKLDTNVADHYIREHYPQFIFHSNTADIDLHGILEQDIQHVLKPQQAAQHLLALAEPDSKQQDTIHLLQLLIENGISQQCLGLTGSLLLNAQTDKSDIDLLVYGRGVFFQTRKAIADLIKAGKLQPLTYNDWQDAYRRRDCSLDFETWLWHEQRKLNKCTAGDSKVDISMILDRNELLEADRCRKKLGRKTLTARVMDDQYAYDFPARYSIDHGSISEVVVYTATYTGQAVKDEMIEASGMLEQAESGKHSLVVGTSREATGEYLKVIQSS